MTNNTSKSTRYRVVYSKTQPVTSKWFDTPEEAERFAATFERNGYSTTIWEYSNGGARPYKKSIKDLFAID